MISNNSNFWKTIALGSMLGMAALLVVVYRQPYSGQSIPYVSVGSPGVVPSLGADRGAPDPKQLSFVPKMNQKRISSSAILNRLRGSGVSYKLADVDLDKMSLEQLQFTAHSILDNTDTVCTRKLRMGNLADGGWEICDDPDVAPEAPCLIYSFGINNDFSFDDDVSRIYGCDVFAFDPSMKTGDHERSKLVHFKKVGISGRTMVNKNKWELFTMNDLRKKYGHTNSPINTIKMDVESSEWLAVPQMLETGAFKDVKQLLIEFHVTQLSKGYLLPKLKLMQNIEKYGFKKFYVNKNFHCPIDVPNYPVKRTMCYEVHYVYRP